MKSIVALTIFILALFTAESIEPFKITEFKTYPHEQNCYTQGLFFLNSTHIFESCGLYNKSYYRVLKYEINSNSFHLEETFKSTIPIDRTVFLEGATYFPKTGGIYILTWREKKVFKLKRESFEIEQMGKWSKDGWGLTNNETHMIVTDGGATLYVVDENFTIINQNDVIDQNGRRVYSINELEYVIEGEKPYIYANVYMERRIIKIDPQSGKVVKEYDLLKVIQNEKGIKYDEVINGIAYDQNSGKFLLTGKNWSNFYLVKLD